MYLTVGLDSMASPGCEEQANCSLFSEIKSSLAEVRRSGQSRSPEQTEVCPSVPDCMDHRRDGGRGGGETNDNQKRLIHTIYLSSKLVFPEPEFPSTMIFKR